MTLTRSQLAVYVITPPVEPVGQLLIDRVKATLDGGATFVQLRRKNNTTATSPETAANQLKGEALAIQRLCKEYNVPFVIDDNVELALAINADGVHIGQDDMPCKEARTIEEALNALEEGADHVGSGAVFDTPTKANAKPLDHKDFETICRSIPIPVVAIGGITEDNMDQLATTGLSGFAIISDIFNDSSIAEKTARIALKAHSMVTRRTALRIAGRESSGGAGIQADLKTMMAHHVYGMSAITALTAQNTIGVTAISTVTPQLLQNQLDAVFTDIKPDAIKIGLLSTRELIEVIADRLRFYNATPVVLDPVMVATSGARLIDEDAIESLTKTLFPLATLVTPNIPEAEILWGQSITDVASMLAGADYIYSTYGCAVLLKGGHSINDANDLLYDETGPHWIPGQRIANPNTHGTGCT